MHPILFQVGGFFIGTYGLFAALGLLIGVFTAAWRAKKNGLDENLILDLAFIGIVAGLLGSRLTYILINFGDFLATFTDPDRSPFEYIFTRQGFVFAGGMLFGALAGIALLRQRRAPVWHTIDCIAPAIPLGHAFGRIGCFSAGCCWGKICHLPWAVSFPAVYGPKGQPMSFVYEDHLRQGLIPPGARRSLPVHPVQLYEAAALAAIFVFLVWLWRRRRFEGQIFLAYLFAYAAARFLLEFFRGDASRGVLLGVSASQYISVGVFLLAVFFWRQRRNIPLPMRVPAAPSPAQKDPRRRQKSKRGTMNEE